MSAYNNQKGFAVVELMVLAVVVVLVAFIGLKVINRSKNVATLVPTQSVSKVSVPKKISSKADVLMASKALDQTTIDTDLDSSQLDSSMMSLL